MTTGGADSDRVLDVDARGLRCPLPVLRLAQAIAARPAGTLPARFRLLATDPAAATDVPAFCRMRGLRLVRTDVVPARGDAGSGG